MEKIIKFDVFFKVIILTLFFLLLKSNTFIAFCDVNIENLDTDSLNCQLSVDEQEKIRQTQMEQAWKKNRMWSDCSTCEKVGTVLIFVGGIAICYLKYLYY